MVLTRSSYARENLNSRKTASQTTPKICKCCVQALISNKQKRKPTLKPARQIKIPAILFLMFTSSAAFIIYLLSFNNAENHTQLIIGQNEKPQSISERNPDDQNLKNAKKEYYNVDKMCDYAQESLGGSILNIGSTELFDSPKSSLICSLSSQLGLILCNPSQAATVILQPQVLPGECWAIKGSRGSATIQLYDYIYVTGVTLEHIPRSVSPTNELSSAPKKFSLTGLVHGNDEEGIHFGTFLYDISDGENSVQYFGIPKKFHNTFKIVRFDILSNWGNEKFTCVYRVRIHGELRNSNNLL